MELRMLASTKWTQIATALVLALDATFPGPAFAAPAASPSIESRSAPKMQRGDLVRLRSGGPLMTVNKVEGDRVDCFWTDWNGQPSDAVFPYDVLQKF
jgi:uncharacterized protein YodC (DUF2158 family)